MNKQRIFSLSNLLTIVVVLMLSGCVMAVPAMVDTNAMAAPQTDVEILEFDIAEDITRFVYDESKVFEDGWPTAGATFITQGYIYPKGTLQGNESGVNEDGTPLYPDKILGEWTCRGWLIGDGGHTESGPMAISTQVYQLGEEYGNLTLVSDGYELAGAGSVVQRAITGGTGDYAHASGTMTQTNLGMTESFGVNLRVVIEISRG